MKQSTPPARRRIAAAGATVALVAVTSMIGIGTTAAVADTTDASTPVASSSAATTATTSDGTTTTSAGTGTGSGSDAGTTGSTTPTTAAEPAAPTAAPAPDTAPATPAPTADPTDGTDASPAAGEPADGTDATPAPAAGTPADGTGATSDVTPAADSSVTWDEPSTPSDRIVYTVTAGSDFSHQFVAHGGDGPLEYGFAPLIGFDALEWFSWGDDGLLRGKPTVVGVYDFDVLATDTRNASTQFVRIVVEPGAAETIGAQVYSHEDGHEPSWFVSAGGDIDPSGGGGLVAAVPVAPGGSLWTSAAVFDHYSNPLNGTEMPSESVLTSSDPADVLSWNATTNTWRATFAAAGDRTLTLTSEGLTVPIAVDVAGTPVFSEPSSADAPIALTATSGTAFSHTFSAPGGIGPVRYSLAGEDGGTVIGDGDFFRSEFSIDPTTGVLSGTPRPATSYAFEVIATIGTRTATAHVVLTVEPGKAIGVLTTVDHGAEGPVFEIAPDGTIARYTADGPGKVTKTVVDRVPANQGIPVFVRSIAVDANGNPTAAHDAPHPTVTSDVATDRITWLPEQGQSQVDFPHASIHTLTVTTDGVSGSFRVDVQPAIDSVSGTTDRPASGSLAYTGADTSGPLTGALGLLAAGGGLLVHRLRRRRS